ncbi:hypothetical protein [Levilactobacillus brevis]|uniref:hypothetical protein n=1 Tax=Levilactobacillus brevis TaxID=1580 RepID=UPI002073AC3C|nr:hypothetical protein [Levilactobacillus brevis]
MQISGISEDQFVDKIVDRLIEKVLPELKKQAEEQEKRIKRSLRKTFIPTISRVHRTRSMTSTWPRQTFQECEKAVG